jgi:hypothetical protein
VKPYGLIDELRDAFPRVPLRARGVFYMYSDGALCEGALDGKSWDEIDSRVISDRSDALAFLDDARRLEWLPMYLHLLSVVDPYWSSVPDTLIGFLLRPEIGDEKRGWKARKRTFDALTDALSDEQKRAVARCLRQFVADYPNFGGNDPQLALDRYWGSFG